MALAYIMQAVLILTHLAGLVVSIILLAKKKGTPAILATAAFGLLFLLDIGHILRASFLDRALFDAIRSASGIGWASGGLTCCCGIFDLAAIVCLIIAIWQALSSRAAVEPPAAEVVTRQE